MRWRWLVVVAVVIRVTAAALLAAGPWTSHPADLAGWDVARFQQLADEPGRPYMDHAVEYPPGSVLLIKGIARSGVVGTHRTLVVLSLGVDLGLAALVGRLGGRRAAAAYLLLGLPLVPMGLLRFDLWAALAAAGGLLALHRRRDGTFGALAAAGALIKIWPALLVVVALALRRWRAAGAAVVALAAGGLAWLAYGGFSLDPVNQVVSLRGATGWHLESIPGSLTALLTNDRPERQLDAFRIGHLDHRLVLAGQAATVAVALALMALAWRSASRLRALDQAGPIPEQAAGPRGTFGLSGPVAVALGAPVMLGATAALIITAPLVSPQFLLWLTPWAALTVPAAGRTGPAAWRLVGLTGAATTVTGVVLSAWGPANVGRTVPALLLLGRDGIVLALVASTLAAVAAAGSGRAEDPLGHGGPGPGPAGAQPQVDQVADVAGRLPG